MNSDVLGPIIEARFSRRDISVSKMREILSELEAEDRLSPNYVGNLSVFRDRIRRLIGFVDLKEDRLDLFDGGRAAKDV